MVRLYPFLYPTPTGSASQGAPTSGGAAGSETEPEAEEERETHHFDPARAGRLKDRDRLARLDYAGFIDDVGVSGGDTVVDIGCGPGLLTVAAADRVGREGLVYALDVSREMLAMARRRLFEEERDNVNLLECGEAGLPLQENVADAACMVFVLHELRRPRTMLADVARVLKPGALFGGLDWSLANTDEGPPAEHRLPPEEAASLLQEAGFRRIRHTTWQGDFYRILAAAPPDLLPRE